MNAEDLKQILADHKKWIEGKKGGKRADFRGADFRGADFRGADLRRADLRGADLRGADLDYSCWPLWCGSLDVIVDKRIAAQLAYHFCRLECDNPEYIKFRNLLVPFANQFHRVDECGELEIIQIPEEGSYEVN